MLKSSLFLQDEADRVNQWFATMGAPVSFTTSKAVLKIAEEKAREEAEEKAEKAEKEENVAKAEKGNAA